MARLTIFDALGGETFFFQLVDRFYAGVANDPILRPMYPEDLGPSRRRLALFLMQFFGGPTTYSQERGHPRLRARHLAFPIDQAARDAWVRHMRAAVDAASLPEEARDKLMRYFEEAATFLINRS